MNFVYQVDGKTALKDSYFDRGIFLHFDRQVVKSGSMTLLSFSLL